MFALIVGLAFVGLLAITLSPVDATDSETAAAVGQLTQQPATPDGNGPEYTGTVLPSMAKVIGALVLVLLCAYGGIFLLKKSMGRRFGGGTGKLLEVIETAHVAQKSSVSLVRIGSKSVLIGVSEAQVSMLSEMDEAETSEMLASIESEQTTQSFETLFSSAKAQWRKLAAHAGKPALKSE